MWSLTFVICCAVRFHMQADAEPSKASHLLVSIHGCQGLVVRQQQEQQGQQQAGCCNAQCPYAHYTPPGRSIGHDTAIGYGPAPVFGDCASWGLLKSAAMEQALRQEHLQVRELTTAMAALHSAQLQAQLVRQIASAADLF
jgi:hypothetical protein